MDVAEAPDCQGLPEPEKVFRYLRCRYIEMGFTLAQARRLAESEADWHQASDLLEHGCPKPLAVKILS